MNNCLRLPIDDGSADIKCDECIDDGLLFEAKTYAFDCTMASRSSLGILKFFLNLAQCIRKIGVLANVYIVVNDCITEIANDY